MIFLREKILKKRFASPGVQPPYPQSARAFRWADPFEPVCLSILAPKKLATSSGGVPGPSLAPAENSKGVPGPSLAPNPHFFTSLGRLRDRSMRKQESSKYTGFYSLYLQWYIPWPLQGDPLAPKKTWPPGSWSPQGPTRRNDTPPREPPGTSRARKPSFLITCPTPLEPSFGKHEYAPFSYQSNIFTLWIAKCDVQGPPWTL